MGIHGINVGSPAPAYTARLDRFTDDGSMPAEPADDLGSVVLSEAFPGAALDPWPAGWTDGSINGGFTRQDGAGVGELGFVDLVDSTGRATADAINLRDIRIAGRMRWKDNTGNTAYFALGLRASGGWGDIYSAVDCYAFERNQTNGTVRLFRVDDAGAYAAIDDSYTLLQQADTLVYAPVDTLWHRFEFEASGAWVRLRMWADGDPRPAAWTVKACDYMHDLAGGAGVAFARSWGGGSVTPETAELDDLVFYNAAAGGAPATLAGAPILTKPLRRRRF